MKKSLNYLFIVCIIASIFICSGCFKETKSENSAKNDGDYVYGELKAGQSIEDIYTLTGNLKQAGVYGLYGSGNKGLVSTSAVAEGGYVAWCEGSYIYSPSSKDGQDVTKKMSNELIKKKGID